MMTSSIFKTAPFGKLAIDVFTSEKLSSLLKGVICLNFPSDKIKNQECLTYPESNKSARKRIVNYTDLLIGQYQ